MVDCNYDLYTTSVTINDDGFTVASGLQSMFPVLLAEIGSYFKLMYSVQTKLHLMGTFCRDKLETALFATAERMLGFF